MTPEAASNLNPLLNNSFAPAGFGNGRAFLEISWAVMRILTVSFSNQPRAGDHTKKRTAGAG